MRTEAKNNQYTVKLETIRKGFDPADDYCWVIPVATPLDKNGDKVLLLTRKCELHKPGRFDIFSSPYFMLSNNSGKEWSNPPEKASGLEEIVDRYWKYVFNGNQKYHRQTEKVLNIGSRIGYCCNNLQYKPWGLEYSVLNDDLTWSKPERLSGLEFAGKINVDGGMQRVELPDGDILLPIYGKESKDSKYVCFTARCEFNGKNLNATEMGGILELNSVRGFVEPSLASVNGDFFITLRNDLHGYVARSEDGLTFSKPVKWIFDDGCELGSYNTQQHWITHNDKLYLVYTRKNADNEHMAIVRHRAPLFMAEVNPEKLCVLRETEQIVVPARGAKLGNFDIVDVNENETWIVVAEWMEEQPGKLVSREYGSDNTIFASKIIWR